MAPEESSQPLTLDHADAAQWNQDLMQTFQAELENNPKTDLLSLVSRSYTREHDFAQYKQISYAAKFNLQTLHELRDKLIEDPEANIRDAIPPGYVRKITMITTPRSPPRPITPEEPPDYRERLADVDEAAVVFPMSNEVAELLSQQRVGHSLSAGDHSAEDLVVRVRELLWNSEILWQNHGRGIVVKCSASIIAKVIKDDHNYTEYTSMQFLEQRMPDIPAPKPHGLIAFGDFRVIFMSYIPGIALVKAWPSLSHDGKVSMQQQLEKLFIRIRSFVQEDGKCLGGVQGEGAKELRVNELSSFKNVTTPEFSDLQFSATNHGSKSYIKLLRSLIDQHDNPARYSGSVFTHGDLHPTNILVRYDNEDHDRCTLTGIIDWEDSGFYPAWHECTTLTRTMDVVEDNDWWVYLPPSISPAKYPIRWLVDWLWSRHLRTT